MGTVVNNLARACYGSRLEEVDAKTLTAIYYIGCAYAPFAELAYAGGGYIVFGQACDEVGLDTIVGQRHGYVGFATTVCGRECGALRKTQIVGCCQTQHYLTKSYNFFTHILELFVPINTILIQN